ncbi:hypothetical protein GF356_09430, partial [candidate division GN15 bacterium]|nr:hypothetical protein [candidate division GN15 bacterium]
MKTAVWAIAGLVILTLSGQTIAGEITEKLDVHITERVRLVTWDNAISLGIHRGVEEEHPPHLKEHAFTRHRTQLGATWKPSDVFHFKMQLANEFRYYVQPSYYDFTWNEIFIDQLSIKLIQPGDLPLTATIGRQNIILGEGFVVMDGSPLDGSRSIYFNALRLDWDLGQKRTLSAFAMYQEETDDFLPVLNEKNQPLLEQTELGLGAYVTAPVGKTKLDLYYIFKRADSSEAIPVTSHIHTLGARADAEFSGGLRTVLEGAVQLGDRGDYNRAGFGAHGYADIKVAGLN